tara:strand:+ start:1174 stop:1833 length:660 start_codon:yes stop_codon:yes gene_type:complete
MTKKIFVAIDTKNISRARKILKEINTEKIKIGYKFGLELFNSKNGRFFISKIKNKVIFADLKLNDIPNTMISTVKAVKDLKVNYLSIHISSGLAALKGVKKIAGKTKIVGVTTLTSLDNKDLKQIGYKRSVKNLVIHQAKLAVKAKLDALVCSAHEVNEVRKIFRKEIITPGIKFGQKNNDQKRVKNPSQINSDWLVIGRSITKGNIKKNIKRLIRLLS